MSRRSVRIAFLTYILFFAALTLWPGIRLINRIEPKILGLPFSLAAHGGLILGAMGMFAMLYLSESRD